MKVISNRGRAFTSLLRANPLAPKGAFRKSFFTPHRTLAQVQPTHDLFNDLWFAGSGPAKLTTEKCRHKSPSSSPPDERALKLGKTLRILQSRLPTLLASPLPPEILSPQITLHLFPSTHPHLPSASGRVAYHAALWTSPITWGRVPLVGNVTLSILSERMFSSTGKEKLTVYWKTIGKTKGKGMGAFYRGIGAGERVDKITEWLGGDARDDEEFMGKFIFEFDEEGRVVKHVIECAEEGGNGDVGRVVGITDWLLGKAKGSKVEDGLVVGCEGVTVDRRERGRRR